MNLNFTKNNAFRNSAIIFDIRHLQFVFKKSKRVYTVYYSMCSTRCNAASTLNS